MPGSMDERVVSMEFDNKQFEKNVKTSMKTLDDLKESLDFDKSADSLDELDKKFKKFGKNNAFEDVDKSCLNLRKSMGLLGDTAGNLVSQFAQVTKITAMFELAEQAVHRLQNAVKQFTIQPIAQGFEKYTTKIESIKTIANATGMAAEAVDQSLDRLNWFTDETSASFDSMVQNIGKFTSVGKGLDESITAMQGIAAWGYHSGASVAEQTRAMYNLSQALGTGSVKLIDWKSIENAGMATKEFKEQAIAAAEAAGTLKRKGDKLFTTGSGKAEEVTVENFNSTLQKGWFSSDVLMDTLKEYGSFADKVRKYQEEHPQYALASEAMEAMDAERLAKQDSIYKKYLDSWSKNAKKSTSAIKDDIARINKIANVKEREKEVKAFAKTIGMSYEDTIKVLDDLADCEESLGEKAFKSSQQAKSFSEAIDATKDAVSTGWMKTFQYIFGGLDKSIELWSDVTEILWDLFAAGAEFRNNAFLHWAEEFNGWADLWNADPEKGPLGALRNIMNTVIDLKDTLGSSFKDVFFPQLARITGEIYGQEDAKLMTKNGLKTTDQLKQWREGNFMGSQLKQMTSNIRKFTASINEFFTNEQNLEKIRNIFTAIATAVRFAVNTLGSFFGSIGDFVKKSGIFQDILNVLSKVATKVTAVFNKLQASGFIQKLFGKISNGFVWFYNLIKGWVNQIREFFDETGIGQAIKDWFNGIIEFFTGSEKDVDENGKRTESGFFRAFGWLQNVKEWFEKIDLKSALYDIKTVIENFGMIWQEFVYGLNGTEVTKDQVKQGGVSDRLAGILAAVSSFGKKLSGVWGTVKGVFETIIGWLESSGILPAIRNFGDTIKTVFDNIGTIWEVFTGILSGKSPMEVLTKNMAKASGGATKLTKLQKILLKVAEFAQKLRGVYFTFKGWFGKALAWISEKWKLFTDWLESSGILPAIRNAWEKIKMFFTNIGLIWKTFTEGFKYGANTKDQFKQGGISDGLAGMLETFSNLGARIRGIVDKVKGAWDKVKTWLETSGILPTLRSWWSSITEWFENVKKDIESNGVFNAVSDFFTGLWEKITGLFGGIGGGGNAPEMPQIGGVAEKSEGFLSGFLGPLKAAFTNKDGQFDLLQGISAGVVGLFDFIASLDWTSVSSSFFGVVVDVINGLDDAVGKLHIDNIIKIFQQIVGAFTGLLVVSTIKDVITTIRAIVKKGKDKSTLEKFTEFLSALGTALLQIGLSVALIAGSMWLISKINPDRFDAAKGVMIGIGVFLVGFIAVAWILTLTMGKDANKLAKTFEAIGKMFLHIALAIAIMVAAIWLMTTMIGDDGKISDKLRSALLVVGGITLVMAGIVVLIGQLTKKVGTVNIAIGIATFAGISILLATCVAAILLLQNVDPGKAFTAIGEIATLLVLITGLIVVLSKIKKFNPKMLVGMIAMAVMLGLVVAAFFLLKDTEPGHIMEIALALSLVIGVLVGALALCGVLGAKVLVGAAVLAGGLVILAVGLAAVAAIATGVMNNVLTFMSTLAAVSVSAQLVDSTAITNAINVLPILMLGLAGISMVNTKPASDLAAAAWDVFNQLAIASTEAMLVSVSEFEKIFGKDGKGGLMQIIQTGLSNVTETGETAKTLGRNLQVLGTNLQLAGRSGMKLGEGSEHTLGIQNIKSRLTDIQEIVNLANEIALGTEGKVDLTTFAEGVANIGAALQLYNKALAQAEMELGNQSDGLNQSDKLAPVSTENIKAALEAIISAIPSTMPSDNQISGIEKWAAMGDGETKTSFALGMVNIANAMSEFSAAAKDFDNEHVDKAVSALQTLAIIKKEVENPTQYDGTISGISGWTNAGAGQNGTFAEAITSMGSAMAEFGESVKDISYGSVFKATLALTMLKNIYKELNGSEDIITYFTAENLLGKFEIGQEKSGKSIEDVFTDFGEGIGKLGGALVTFGRALNVEGYDEDKVKTATSILKQMTEMQTLLQSTKFANDWWTTLWFGNNDLSKLQQNMAGLGARLTTFSNELKDFDLDIESSKWKNVSGVLTFLKDIWVDLNGLGNDVNEFDAETGNITKSSIGAGYTLESLANGIDKIRESLVSFNEKMTAKDNLLGSWSSDNWNNITSMLNDVKQLAIDIKGQNLSESDIKLIGTFGDQIGDLFGRLNNRDGGFNAVGADGVSNLVEFAKKIGPDSGFDSGSFSTFITNLKSLAEAAGVLHSQNIDWADIDNMAILAERIMSITSTGFNGEAFNTSGAMLATGLLTGFVNRLASTDVSEDSITIGTAMESLLAILDSYSESFFDRGKTAGQQYAAGFKEGMNEVSGFLTPVVSMDNNGNTSGNDAAGSTSLTSILTAMNYVKVTDISAAVTNIQSMKDKLNGTIKVDDGHASVLNTMKDRLGDLDSIKKDVDSIKAKVNKFAVYIYPNDLVGAIIDDMDRALGNASRVGGP